MVTPSCEPGDGIDSGSRLGRERSNLRKESLFADHGPVTVTPNRNDNRAWLRPIRDPGIARNDDGLRFPDSACDLLLVPSRIDNFPSVALEVQRCELPVVAFRVGGLAAMVEHRVNGDLAEPEDPQDLALDIDWLPGLDAHTRQRMGRHSRQWVTERCSPGIVARRYADVYAQALDSANG